MDAEPGSVRVQVYLSSVLCLLGSVSRVQTIIEIRCCPGFGWNKVNFLLSSWYSAVFWIQDKKNVDNTLMV